MMMRRMMAMKVSKISKKKFLVYRGSKEKTTGGLTKNDLVKNKRGKIVSKKSSLRAKKSKSYKAIIGFSTAVVKARKALGVKGWCPVGGKTAQGQALLAKARSFYKK